MLLGNEPEMAAKSRKIGRSRRKGEREYHSIPGAKMGAQGREMAWFLRRQPEQVCTENQCT